MSTESREDGSFKGVDIVQLGMIGMGRMGANMARRLMRAGHECIVFDVSPKAVAAMEDEGAAGATSQADWCKS